MSSVSLAKVANITTGKLDANAAVEGGAYPFFTCAEEPLRIDSFAFDDDAVLLAGNNAHGIFHINRYNGQFNAYQRTYVITAKEGYSIDFIRYAIEQHLLYLRKSAQGSQTKFLTMSALESIAVEELEYNTQLEKVASLIFLDKKISLKKQINETIHSMLYDLYMHSFFKKEPNGILSDIIIEHPKSSIQVCDVEGTIGEYPFFTSGDAVLESQDYLVDGRNVLLNTGGNADVKFYVGKMAYSTDTWCVGAKENMDAYLYMLLYSIKNELNQKYFLGTGLKHLQKPLLKNREIYIPSELELNHFNSVAANALNIISDNKREKQFLLNMRGWLFPLIMNGQVKVS